MLFEHDLRTRLRARRDRLYRKSEPELFDNELTFFMKWLQGEPYIAALLREIETAPITLDEWECPENLSEGTLRFPDTEHERAKICLELCRKGEALSYAMEVGPTFNVDTCLRYYVEVFVDPLLHYLEDRIEGGSAILAILERYKRRSEWFHRQSLYDRYLADTSKGEARLDDHLREYLVDQGVAYPFSKPQSPSGEADVVAGLDSGDPLALEIKVFGGPNSYGSDYVRKGFAQACRYACDYNLPAGYLVVYNLSEKLLLFETKASIRWPPAIRVADRTVFLVSIDIHPATPRASKDRKLDRHVIAEEYLLDRDR